METEDEHRSRVMLARMAVASSQFYNMAVSTGCHAFIEFTGLMNEYIVICKAMTAEGDYSWMNANTHTEAPLLMREMNVAYLAEKLDCIYGPTLRSSAVLKKVFEEGA